MVVVRFAATSLAPSASLFRSICSLRRLPFEVLVAQRCQCCIAALAWFTDYAGSATVA